MPRHRLSPGRFLLLVVVLAGCAPAAIQPLVPSASTPSHATAPVTATAASAIPGSLVLAGRIVTMADPPSAEALRIEDGVVAAVGGREEILAAAGDGVPVIDLGDAVAYPGFIDAHAHWIGDRGYYGAATPAEAMDAALTRGWTSISEQWVNDERLVELERLAEEDALPLRVDAYLTLNEPGPDGAHFGDWYAGREPGTVTEMLRVRGLKMHLDNDWGRIIHWAADDLTATIGRADDAGWQVSVHTVTDQAHELVLDAFEAAIGPDGPNPLHHRIEHAVIVTDDHLARMVAMDLAVVAHLDGAASDWILGSEFEGLDGATKPGIDGTLARWRDFVDAGLHVAASTDAPWFFPDFRLTDDIGRPVDQVAGGMDARGRAFAGTPDWMLGQRLAAEQGLRAITTDAAWALGDEARRGHLAPGTLGDVTVLSGDLLSASPDEIRAMTVLATVVGGTVVHCGDPLVCGVTAAAP
ncbi:MAG TPA: amidohydrolase family protein [Candidatus Limnocylindrales bacterium]|nr:amidohydrolase family protein [Candidatus Limnocylindrales bacterium]